MRTLLFMTGLLLSLVSTSLHAWWNDQWGSRRMMTIDAGATGADISGNVTDFPLLVRLHAGNFAYFAELAENGKDLRFLKDDKVSLKHSVEKLDGLSELGLIWIRIPEVRGGAVGESIAMYYGNAEAADGSDSAAVYDVHQALVYHFEEGVPVPVDATAYHTNPQQTSVTADPNGFIGAAARFDGSTPITVEPQPQLALDPAKGWSFSAWFKTDQEQPDSALLMVEAGDQFLRLQLRGTTLAVVGQVLGGGVILEGGNLPLAAWNHVAVVLSSDRLTLYVNGTEVGQTPLSIGSFTPKLTLGSGFTGLIDEVEVATTARSADWIKLSYRTQSPDFQVLAFGQDESGGGSGTGHFMVIIQNVTLDGWVIIGLTGIMLVVALAVIVVKTLVIRRVSRDNRMFLDAYQRLDVSQLYSLDREDEESDSEESDLVLALSGEHDHFQSSPIYHLYHAGIRELRKLGDGELRPDVSPEDWEYLRVKLDSQVVREVQRLNSNMVLLTIAIAGGPFLGLLGTVLGVMITFAVIAATGDVNINSIAPGIAAALLATVAGLAVAIPALFAYNYLLTRIKEITADMRVFTDEFLALLAMQSKKLSRRDR